MAEDDKHKKSYSEALPWVIGLVILLAAAVFGGLYWDRTSSIDQVVFKGYEYVSLQQLKQHVQIPKDINPDSLNFEAIVHHVKEIPYVEKVRLSVQPGGKMVVRISERKPIALLMHNGYRCLVDSNGVKLKLVSSEIPNVPLVYGFPVKPLSDTLNSRAFNTVSAFILKLMKNPASNATVSAVAWSEENGVVALSANGNVRLIFGKNHFKRRLRNWEAFYAQVVRYKGIDHFESVNMSFKGQIVTHE